MKEYSARLSTDGQARISTSGRLCLFGEHSDWAAQHRIHPGYCISIGTDQCIRATAQSSDRLLIETIVPDKTGKSNGRTRQMSCRWEAECLREAAEDELEFFRYCAGVSYQALKELGVSGGVEVHITDMDLPLKKGVSSSAAVCVLMAEALNEIWDLRLSRRELMELAYKGERLTGSQCGRMDQSCIYGKTPVLLTFDRPDSVHVEKIHCSDSVHMFFVDLAGKKDTVKILKDLQESYLVKRDLREALGLKNREITRRACQALGDGDAQALGYLMAEAQAAFDEFVAPCSPEELNSPELHKLLSYKPLLEYVYGGKGVGSQGDGTAQFVARSEGDRDAAISLVESTFPQMRCFPLTILETGRVRTGKAGARVPAKHG